MKSAAGGRLDYDIERLAESINLPRLLPGPTLEAVSGLPGTGKSYFSSKLAERLPSLILESDAFRNSLFYLPIYSPGESPDLFRKIERQR
jgi:hypothetical protein